MAMKALLDTDIILDVLADRVPYTSTLRSASISEWEICVPSSSVIKGYSMTIPPAKWRNLSKAAGKKKKRDRRD